MTIYANVTKNSKYAKQRTEQPFPVELVAAFDAYCWAGNDNRYRTEDLEFYVKNDKLEFDAADATGFARSGLLSFGDPMLERLLQEDLDWTRKMAESKDLGDREHVWNRRGSKVALLMREILEAYPKQTPTCGKCGNTARTCQCY